MIFGTVEVNFAVVPTLGTINSKSLRWHATSRDLLREALDELQYASDPGHRQLAMLLRAVGYGGSEVRDFCAVAGAALVSALLRRAALPNGSFDDDERELFRHASGALPYLRGGAASAEPLTMPRHGEPGAEAWVVASILGAEDVPRPVDSIWWPTIHHQAEAL